MESLRNSIEAMTLGDDASVKALVNAALPEGGRPGAAVLLHRTVLSCILQLGIKPASNGIVAAKPVNTGMLGETVILGLRTQPQAAAALYRRPGYSLAAIINKLCARQLVIVSFTGTTKYVAPDLDGLRQYLSSTATLLPRRSNDEHEPAAPAAPAGPPTAHLVSTEQQAVDAVQQLYFSQEVAMDLEGDLRRGEICSRRKRACTSAAATSAVCHFVRRLRSVAFLGPHSQTVPSTSSSCTAPVAPAATSSTSSPWRRRCALPPCATWRACSRAQT